MVDVMDLKPDIREESLCRRCGVCCRKGGPALHVEDMALVKDGRIPLSHLFTIRRHEPAYDNVVEALSPAATDIVKIKSAAANSAVCIYYRRTEKACGIYSHRPLECRTLSCRQPASAIAGYRLDRLTREHLLAGIEGLWGLVSDHQQHCDYRLVARLAADLRQDGGDGQAMDRLLEIMRYDHFIRRGLLDHSPPAEEKLDFLFGRALTLTIGMFQLKLIRNGSQVLLQPFVAT